jgi:hypothetical protein
MVLTIGIAENAGAKQARGEHRWKNKILDGAKLEISQTLQPSSVARRAAAFYKCILRNRFVMTSIIVPERFDEELLVYDR